MIHPMPKILVRPPSFVLLLWCAAVPLVGPARGADEQVVREQHTVAIDGVRETWQLVWEGKPATVCGPDEVYMAITCPCSGWAYAEYGRLYLVRNRGGSETRSELVVSANHGAIRVKEREYSCPGKGKAEKLLEETDK